MHAMAMAMFGLHGVAFQLYAPAEGQWLPCRRTPGKQAWLAAAVWWWLCLFNIQEKRVGTPEVFAQAYALSSSRACSEVTDLRLGCCTFKFVTRPHRDELLQDSGPRQSGVYLSFFSTSNLLSKSDEINLSVFPLNCPCDLHRHLFHRSVPSASLEQP